MANQQQPNENMSGNKSGRDANQSDARGQQGGVTDRDTANDNDGARGRQSQKQSGGRSDSPGASDRMQDDASAGSETLRDSDGESQNK